MAQQIGREEAVRRLKAHGRSNMGAGLDADKMAESVEGETDRGAVIILATVIEDVLAEQIRGKMGWLSADERSRLFGPDGPLGTFSALIRMAHALGVIDRDLMRACDIVREMRNACAHSRKPISFQDDVLWDAFEALARKLAIGDLPQRDPEQGKFWFGILVGFIWQAAKHGREAATHHVNRIIQEGIAEARALKTAEPPETSPDKPQ